MKEYSSRTQEVNRALAARRALMQRRILIGRIILIVWAAFAFANLIFLRGSTALRLPLSCTSADFCVMMRFLYPDAGGSILLYIPAILLPVLLAVSAWHWPREGAVLLRRGAFLLIWLDVILGLSAYIWNPAILFGESNLQTALAVLNLVFHIFLVWNISRARRAVESLEILPEQEIEGDPFEEFRKSAKKGDES